jgi:hypothetical protein
MYRKEEYIKRIDELGDVAMNLIMNQTPDETRKIASEMSAEDAYILGVHIGKILQSAKLVPFDSCFIT